nr:unnamed protein product [Haemonchus contortus]
MQGLIGLADIDPGIEPVTMRVFQRSTVASASEFELHQSAACSNEESSRREYSSICHSTGIIASTTRMTPPNMLHQFLTVSEIILKIPFPVNRHLLCVDNPVVVHLPLSIYRRKNQNQL